MASAPRTLQLRIDLDHASPPIWRRVLVAADTCLAALHAVIQEAFGWEDCHLHQFQQGRRRFEPPDADGPDAAENERAVTVGQLLRRKGDRLKYVYDFGDDWWHTLRLEALLPPEADADALPRLIGGARARPPEDCGGMPGFHAFLLEQALDRSGPCVFDPRAFSLAAADARLGWIRGGGPEPEPDGRGMTITQPTSSAPGPPSTPASWSPLEERLVWQRLEGLLAAPEWREAAELARSIFEAGLEVCPSAVERAALLAEPRFEQLRFDYLACDLVFDRKQRPPVLELLAASSGAGLTPGAAEFLAALFRSCLGLYRIEAVRADGTLRLWDVAGERRFEASPPQPDFDAESGRLLISRVLPGRDGLARLRGGLTAPYVVEELGDLLRHLTQDCRAAGGDHQDPFQLLKPSAPYLVAFWFVQTRRDGEGGLRLALGAGEVWEPGVGEYGVPRGGDLAAVAAALDRCPELIAHLTDLWMLPAGGGGGEEAAGWLKLHDQGLYLFAANRGSMKVLRETLKRAGCPGLRHRVTRYDPGLRLPLVPVERS